MLRKTMAGSRRKRDLIRWRNHEVTRIEAFSDAVFAFAVTLLVFSLEVPKTFHEMYEGMKSFFPFAICFALLFQVWMTQNIYFRRYSLHDDLTLVLNGSLLFVVLFFVYPLKFLFNSVILRNGTIESIDEVKHLFYIYSGPYAIIFILFALMYANALRHKDELELTPSEQFETRTNIYRNLGIAGVGVLSLMMAAMGGYFTAFAWVPYPLIGVYLTTLHARRATIHDRLHLPAPAKAEHIH